MKKALIPLAACLALGACGPRECGEATLPSPRTQAEWVTKALGSLDAEQRAIAGVDPGTESLDHDGCCEVVARFSELPGWWGLTLECQPYYLVRVKGGSNVLTLRLDATGNLAEVSGM